LESRRNIKGLGRHAMVASLGLSGLRISELVDLPVAAADLWIGSVTGSLPARLSG
jgi:site-specific recombinase XerD